jgi:PqqD family protein of HPr-rel-A system
MTIAWRTGELLWRQWEGETVVFNVSSGNTHLMSTTAVEVLRLIKKDALTAEEISRRLMTSAGDSCDEEVVTNVENLLRNLDHLGLIEPVSQ